MIGLVIRLILGRSVGGFWVGLVMLVVGVGLTAVSYTAATAASSSSYIVFIGLIIGGLVRMALSATSLFSGSERGRSAVLPLIPGGFVAPPSEVSPGLCWQCGAKVKPDRLICLRCGATQPVSPPEPSAIAQLVGFDTDTSLNPIPRPVRTVAGPPPSRGVAPGSYPAEAPGRGMSPGAMPPGGPYRWEGEPR
jgi:hypothetical protein